MKRKFFVAVILLLLCGTLYGAFTFPESNIRWGTTHVLKRNGDLATWVAEAEDIINAGGTFAGGSISGDVVMANGKYIRSTTTTSQATALQVYDTDTGPGYTNALSWTNGSVPALVLGAATNSLAIASTGLNVSTAGAVTGVTTLDMTGDLSMANGKAIKTSTTAGHSVAIQARDTNAAAWRNVISGTAGSASTPVVVGNATGTTTVTSSDWGIDSVGAATGIASVAFDDGATVYHKLVSIDNAAVKTLYSAPTVLVAAPGTHNVVELVSAVLLYDYSTAGFNTASNNITIEYGATAAGATASSAISQNGFLDQTGDMVVRLIPVAVAATTAAAIENQPLVLYCATADPTTGGGVMRVQISYRIVPTGF